MQDQKFQIKIEDFIYQQYSYNNQLFDFFPNDYTKQLFNYGLDHKVTDLKLKEFINPFKQVRVVEEQTIKDMEMFQQNLKFLIKFLDHPVSQRIQQIYQDEEKKNYYIVTEQYGKECQIINFINKDLSEEVIARIIRQLLSLVAFYHEQGAVHRNISQETVQLINDPAEGIIKLGGYSCLTSFIKDQPVTENQAQISYKCLPPEFYHTQKYNELIDEWQIGLIMLALLSKQDPFYDLTKFKIEKKVKDNSFDISSLQINENAKDLLTKLLTTTAETRIKASDALQHQWITKMGGVDENLIKSNFSEVLEVSQCFLKADLIQQAIMLYIGNYCPQIYFQENLNVYRLAGFDKNVNGYITKQQLEQSFATVIEDKEEAKKQSETIFHFFDINNDGKIPFSMVNAIASTKQDLHNYEYMRAAFIYFDVDQDGFLTLEDLKLSFRGADKKEEELKQIVEKYDLNKDGAISFNEFQLIMFTLLEKDEYLYDHIKVDLLHDKRYFPKGYNPFDLQKLEGQDQIKKIFLHIKQFFRDYQIDITQIQQNFDNYNGEWDKEELFPQLIQIFDSQIKPNEIEELFTFLDFNQKGYVSSEDIQLAFPLSDNK